MIKLILERAYLPTGTIGTLMAEHGEFSIKTLELSYKENQQNISCIPEGEYVVNIYQSQKFGKCFKILGVPNRTDILIHSGNILKDTKGCILVGNKFIFDDYDIEDNIKIINSRNTLKKLLEFVGEEEICLLIKSKELEC